MTYRGCSISVFSCMLADSFSGNTVRLLLYPALQYAYRIMATVATDHTSQRLYKKEETTLSLGDKRDSAVGRSLSGGVGRGTKLVKNREKLALVCFLCGTESDGGASPPGKVI